MSAGARLQAAGSILAIGIFDGFHLGHQKIIRKVLAEARSNGAAAGVLSFYPHPDKVLNHRPLQMIQTLEQRLKAFEQAGLDFCLLLDLDQQLSGLSGETFARQIIKQALKVKEVVIGRNFRFGHHRQWGTDDLEKFGRHLDFKVITLKPAVRQGHLISSSLIRQFLKSGQVEEASRLLGHPYEISGRIVAGHKLGRQLGYPTINLDSRNDLLPSGVFICLTKIKDEIYQSVSNIGTRPTLGGKIIQVETHLLDLSRPFYRQKVSLFLLKKLRTEKKFSSLEALQEAIARDVLLARKYFKSTTAKSLIKSIRLDI